MRFKKTIHLFFIYTITILLFLMAIFGSLMVRDEYTTYGYEYEVLTVINGFESYSVVRPLDKLGAMFFILLLAFIFTFDLIPKIKIKNKENEKDKGTIIRNAGW